MQNNNSRVTTDFAQLVTDLNSLFKELPRWAGNEALNFYRDSFQRQAYIDAGVKRWQGRKNDKSNKRTGRSLLTQSGRLRRSLRLSVVGNNISISTDVPYAKGHNEGELIQKTVAVRRHRRKVASRNTLRTVQGKEGKKSTRVHFLKNSSGITFVKSHTRKMNTQLPQRQFIDIPNRPISNFLEKRIALHVQKAIEKVMPKG